LATGELITEGQPALPGALVRHPGLQMALATFAILVVELALIRWVGTQIRIAAYFANLVLIAAFLGMGLGVALGRRRPALFRHVFPLLALLVCVLSLAEPLGFMRLRFPDPSVSLWGAEAASTTLAPFALAVAALLLCFWAIAAIFLAAGVPVGALFARMPALTAYRWDLAGSLLGVVAMSFVAWLGAPPPVWFGLGLLAWLLLDPRPLGWLFAAAVVAASLWSVNGAVFSPYNRIDVEPLTQGYDHAPGAPPTEWNVSVNRDYHQLMLDLRPWPGQDRDLRRKDRARVQAVYELPFKAADGRGSALVVGAGTGNDVAAALRVGYERVVSVDIDPRIIALGRQLHPEQPYSDPRVVPVVNDARAYLEQNLGERFDTVCYGLLDSHAMFSAMSSLRLDNYVYTREGIEAGWRHVKEDGVLSVSFSVYAGDWMVQRIYRLLREATGLTPVMVPHNYNFGMTFLVGRGLTPERVGQAFPEISVGFTENPAIKVPSDDWPFLYLRPGTLPVTYLAVVALIAFTALLALRGVFGARAFRAGAFDPQAFLLGAAFMLLETRMVTELSLLFGSTWVVNSCVFGGILVMVLLGNAVAERFRPKHVERWFLPLAATMLAIWFFSAGTLNALPLLQRGVVAGLLYALPVFFAGVIFSTLLSRRADTSATLGSNLCGSVLGGLLEYLSTLVGMKAIGLLALAIYLGAALVHARGQALDRNETV
jgi:hypothetical protein